jgi:hypothetical protein
MGIVLKVNNQRELHLTQTVADGPTYLTAIGGDESTEYIMAISAGDFVTMLNWYRHQKNTGNASLHFD